MSRLPVIRGLADERLRLQIDGMDLYAACPNHMNTPLSYLDPGQVERVRVWAGIAPVSAGGDAIGGVVAAETPALAQTAIARIEEAVGLPVYAFPKEEEYFVELRLPALPTAGEAHGA